jgi:phospholipid/cholesterol/gamma-HCH transport system ATP-binding protein
VRIQENALQLHPINKAHGKGSSGTTRPYLGLEHTSLGFGSHQVFNDLTFNINAGETTCVLGRSGVGKSVCLRLFMGFLRPDRGRVFAAGEDITGYSEQELERIRKRITMVFQSGALFDSLTVAENVTFPLRERKQMDQTQIDQVADGLLSVVHAQQWRDSFPNQIPTGAKRLVAIARALAAQSEAVLYDEPTTNVDPLMERSVATLLRKLKHDLGLTSVVVTHDVKLVESIADRVIFLDEGRVIFCGTKEEMHRSSVPLVRKFLELDLTDLKSMLRIIEPMRPAA